MSNEQINLKPVCRAILEVYKEVAKLCNKHKLRYYLTDGSAIGAVRHHGFIPWDDDLDMSMPRQDYETFKKLAAKELPSHLSFVNWENTPEFSLLFGQVHDNRSEYVKRVEEECGYPLSLGIYIDIIPIDGYPTSSVEKFFVEKYAYLLRAIWRAKAGVFANQSIKGKILMIIGRVVCLFMPWIKTSSDALRISERMQIAHPFEGSVNSSRASIYLTGLNRPPLPSSWWGNPSWHNFEDIQVPLPEAYDKYLRFYYGDYMRLPPPEKQHPQHKYVFECPWRFGPTKG